MGMFALGRFPRRERAGLRVLTLQPRIAEQDRFHAVARRVLADRQGSCGTWYAPADQPKVRISLSCQTRDTSGEKTVTESEWLACTDPTPMLEFLRGKASERKLRLFACACCQAVLPLIHDKYSRKAVKTAERYADEIK
jgi:hypothetical protein